MARNSEHVKGTLVELDALVQLGKSRNKIGGKLHKTSDTCVFVYLADHCTATVSF